MKKIIYSCAMFLAINFAMQAQETPVDGFVMPRKTTAQRTNTTNFPTTTPKGTQVYDLDTKSIWYWDGTVWVNTAASSGGDPTTDAWVDDATNTMVKLGTTSTGAARAAGTEFVALDNGNVGIGTSAPIAQLHIEENTDGALNSVYVRTVTPAQTGSSRYVVRTGTGGGSIQLNEDNVTGDLLAGIIPNSRLMTISAWSGSVDNMVFDAGRADMHFLSGNPTKADYMTIKNTGKVGIGTITPANLLDVEGGVAIGATYSGTTAAPTNGAIIEGNTGIGVNAPTAKLDVNGGGANNGYAFKLSDGVVGYMGGENTVGGVAKIYLNSSSGLGFNAGQSLNTTTVLDPTQMDMYINTAGNVGIGNYVPAGLLHVDGNKDNPFPSGSPDDTQAANDFVVMPTTGNVGIGTITPSTKLQVKVVGDVSTLPSPQALDDFTVVDPSFAYSNMMGVSGGGYWIGDATNVHMAGIFHRASDKRLEFYTNGTTKMRIFDDGNVVMGASSVNPTVKLSVEGAIKITTATGSTGLPSHVSPSGTIIFQNAHFYGNTDGTATGWKQLD